MINFVIRPVQYQNFTEVAVIRDKSIVNIKTCSGETRVRANFIK